jgi:hypothetical protein
VTRILSAADHCNPRVRVRLIQGPWRVGLRTGQRFALCVKVRGRFRLLVWS